MRSPDICACITAAPDAASAHRVRDLVALYEVRIDLIGEDWPRVAAGLPRPWIACNRLAAEGGASREPEAERLETLKRAVAFGAAIVDVELASPGLNAFAAEVKGAARLLISHHDLAGTGTEEELAELVNRERAVGADICKVVTTAKRGGDNAVVLRLAHRFAGTGVVTLAMGPLGMASRILSPLAGSVFTYASLASGHESAPGQLTVEELHAVYQAMGGAL